MNDQDLFPIEPDALERLHARLEVSAAEARLLDVAYRIIDTPVGQLLLAATDRGLLRSRSNGKGSTRCWTLATRVSPRILHSPSRLDQASNQFEEYFAGRLHHFHLPLDHRLSSGSGRRFSSTRPGSITGTRSATGRWPSRLAAERHPRGRHRLRHQSATGRGPLPPVLR